MTMMRPWDEWGVEMIPIRLVMSLAMIATIVGLCMAGYLASRPVSNANMVQKECEEIACEMAGLVRGGAVRDLRDPTAAWGTRRVLVFKSPRECLYISFGGDPDPDDDGILDNAILGSGANIVYRVQGASKGILWLSEPVGFRAGIRQDDRWRLGDGSLVLAGGGTTTLVFELVRDETGMFILVYPSV